MNNQPQKEQQAETKPKQKKEKQKATKDVVLTLRFKKSELENLIKCPKCKSNMSMLDGQYGYYLKCRSKKCDESINIERKRVVPDVNSEAFKAKFEEAPKAEDGTTMILRRGQYGLFWSHEDKEKKENKPLLLKEKCPECGANLVLRLGQGGRFIGCSKYPDCKFTKQI